MVQHYPLWERVIKVVSSFPGVIEKPCHGTPAYYIEKKMFTRLQENGETLVVYNNDRDEWIASDPETFFFTDHYKNYPLLLIDLKQVTKKDLENLLFLSWEIRAPKRLLKTIKG
jgi:hypothetical protein